MSAPRNPDKPVTRAGYRILEHLARDGRIRLERIRWGVSGRVRDGGRYNYRALSGCGDPLSRTFRRFMVEELQQKGYLTPDPQEPRLTPAGRDLFGRLDRNGCWLEGKAS